MDFMRLLKSIEELLYEVATWVLFYPLTVARVVRRPVAMMAYAERELGDEVEEQYVDALSPPICLLITLFLLHIVERIFPRVEAEIPGVLSSDNNLLAFRAVLFSIFPLLLGLVHLKQRGVKLTRHSLRPSFYAQCYVAVPFVVAASLSLSLASRGLTVPGLALMAAGYAWYAAVQTIWQSRDGKTSRAMALLASSATIVGATILLIAATAITGFAIGMVPPAD